MCIHTPKIQFSEVVLPSLIYLHFHVYDRVQLKLTQTTVDTLNYAFLFDVIISHSKLEKFIVTLII